MGALRAGAHAHLCPLSRTVQQPAVGGGTDDWDQVTVAGLSSARQCAAESTNAHVPVGLLATWSTGMVKSRDAHHAGRVARSTNVARR